MEQDPASFAFLTMRWPYDNMNEYRNNVSPLSVTKIKFVLDRFISQPPFNLNTVEHKE